jgi:hypothetical protein
LSRAQVVAVRGLDLVEEALEEFGVSAREVVIPMDRSRTSIRGTLVTRKTSTSAETGSPAKV